MIAAHGDVHGPQQSRPQQCRGAFVDSDRVLQRDSCVSDDEDYDDGGIQASLSLNGPMLGRLAGQRFGWKCTSCRGFGLASALFEDRAQIAIDPNLAFPQKGPNSDKTRFSIGPSLTGRKSINDEKSNLPWRRAVDGVVFDEPGPRRRARHPGAAGSLQARRVP